MKFGLVSVIVFLLSVCAWVGTCSAQLYPDTVAVADAAQVADSGYVITDGQSDVATHKGPKKLKVVRRHYNYKEQIGFALGMMAFIALIMTTTQSWNPQ